MVAGSRLLSRPVDAFTPYMRMEFADASGMYRYFPEGCIAKRIEDPVDIVGGVWAVRRPDAASMRYMEIFEFVVSSTYPYLPRGCTAMALHSPGSLIGEGESADKTPVERSIENIQTELLPVVYR